jgi:hypothetical protein
MEVFGSDRCWRSSRCGAPGSIATPEISTPPAARLAGRRPPAPQVTCTVLRTCAHGKIPRHPWDKAATEAQRLNFGCGQTILIESERIKRQTIANPRLLHPIIQPRKPEALLFQATACPNNPDDGYPGRFGGAPGLISIVLALFATSAGFLMLRWRTPLSK